MFQLVFGEVGRGGEFSNFFALKNVILTHTNDFCEEGFN
jgi:hypothetical protein